MYYPRKTVGGDSLIIKVIWPNHISNWQRAPRNYLFTNDKTSQISQKASDIRILTLCLLNFIFAWKRYWLEKYSWGSMSTIQYWGGFKLQISRSHFPSSCTTWYFCGNRRCLFRGFFWKRLLERPRWSYDINYDVFECLMCRPDSLAHTQMYLNRF